MIIAGEASGDNHGGGLISALKRKIPDLEIFGVGGSQMQKAGAQLYYHIDDLAFIGFSEVLKNFFYFKKIFDHLLAVLDQRQPDLIILIDYPGFNLRFAKKVKKRGYKIFYFVAPQVWAWAQGRAKKMAKYIDRLAVLFDFEVDFFKRYGLETHFVGHPLVEKLASQQNREDFFYKNHLDKNAPLLALFPGSRRQEVQNLLLPMIDTALILRSKNPILQIAVGKASTISYEFLKNMVSPEIHIIENDNYELMKFATAGIVASGTATLEMGFFGTPFIIIYKVSAVTHFLGKMVIKIPYIGLVNVVLGNYAIHEFIQKEATAEKMVPFVEDLLYNPKTRERLMDSLNKVAGKLGAPGAMERAAKLILQMI